MLFLVTDIYVGASFLTTPGFAPISRKCMRPQSTHTRPTADAFTGSSAKSQSRHPPTRQVTATSSNASRTSDNRDLNCSRDHLRRGLCLYRKTENRQGCHA
ncbi:unnamed protein product [Cercospora beticola]|nr:unnamed protein product [Cercospora beticola]